MHACVSTRNKQSGHSLVLFNCNFFLFSCNQSQMMDLNGFACDSVTAFLSNPVGGGEIIFPRVKSPEAAPDAPVYRGTDEDLRESFSDVRILRSFRPRARRCLRFSNNRFRHVVFSSCILSSLCFFCHVFCEVCGRERGGFRHDFTHKLAAPWAQCFRSKMHKT
jgi:hypothetical protein